MVSHFYDPLTQYRKKKISVCFFYSSCPSVPTVKSSAEQNEGLGLCGVGMCPPTQFCPGSPLSPSGTNLLSFPFLLESAKEFFHLLGRNCLIPDNLGEATGKVTAPGASLLWGRDQKHISSVTGRPGRCYRMGTVQSLYWIPLSSSLFQVTSL